MTIHFSVDEILKMAEQIERNGVLFYRGAAEKASGASIRQLLLELALMEEDHERIFAAMRGELSERERESPVPDPEREGTAYLMAWADGNVFDMRAGAEPRLTGKETLEDIFRLAIGIEKDSIVFYLGMKEALPPRLGREKVDRIIEEEMRHVYSLSRMLATRRHQLI
ncbi:MAG: ferritin family protein [Deltaproteobacteria bacterium]|nr:ferritin family protein [Deltaproteobacteria bacterium]